MKMHERDKWQTTTSLAINSPQDLKKKDKKKTECEKVKSFRHRDHIDSNVVNSSEIMFGNTIGNR